MLGNMSHVFSVQCYLKVGMTALWNPPGTHFINLIRQTKKNQRDKPYPFQLIPIPDGPNLRMKETSLGVKQITEKRYGGDKHACVQEVRGWMMMMHDC